MSEVQAESGTSHDAPVNGQRLGLARRLSIWRERRVVATALRQLGPITTVLDTPCAPGRLIPVLNLYRLRVVLADVSLPSVTHVLGLCGGLIRPPDAVVASPLRLPLADESVDAVLCSRFLNRFALAEDRIAILRELARVCRVGAVVTFFDAASLRHRGHVLRHQASGSGRLAITRSQFKFEVERAGMECLSMHALLRFHMELTAAALRKRPDA
jgi:hypothetical protein